VAPDSLTIAAANSVALPIPDASAGSLVPRLAAGRSGSTLHDQLILSYVQTPQSSQGLTAKLVLIDLNASLQPTVEATYNLAVPYTFDLLRSGRLNWFSQFDQAVLLAVEAAPPPRLYVVTIASDGTFNSAGADIGARPCYLDLAVGNFDHMKPNPPPTNEHDPNLQFGLVTSDCGISVRVDMYDVNPQALSPRCALLVRSLW
jgi:hypothetical protein